MGRFLQLLQLLMNQLQLIPTATKAAIPILGAVTAFLVALNETGSLVAPVMTRHIALAPMPNGYAVIALPLENLSPEPADLSISRGLSVAINNALFRVRNLRVLSSTSALRLTAKDVDPVDLGKSVGLTHIIEGYIQRVEDGLLISVDLVRLSDRTQLWSRTFSMDVCNDAAERCDDGFRQNQLAADIASDVAAQLKLQVRHRITESAAYREAVRLVETRQGQLTAAINYLAPRVGMGGEWRDVASAWELLALSYRLRITYDRSRSGDGVAELTAARNKTCERPLNEDKPAENTPYEDRPLNVDTEPLTGARLAAEQAVGHNAQSALGHAMLASVMAQCGKWVEAMREGREAFSLDPNDPIILHDFSQILTIVGYIREALEQREILTTLAPDIVPYNLVTADILAINGRRLDAIRALERVPEKGPQDYFRNAYLARAYASTGRYSLAADTLRQITGPQVSTVLKNKIAQLLRDRGVTRGTVIPPDDLVGELSFAYLYIGVSPTILPEILLSSNLYYIGQRTMSVAGMRALWLPELRAVRQSSAFKELIKAAKLDDFWRQMGWPDLCRPRGPEDFVCN